MDAINLLRADHPLIQWLSDEYEQLPVTARDARTQTVGRLRSEVDLHLGLCTELFYPAVRAWQPNLDDVVLDQIRAARAIALLSVEVDHLAAQDHGYQTKVDSLIRSVRHHLVTEEERLLPAVQASADPSALADLGERLSNLRAILAADPRIDDRGHPTAMASAAGAMVIDAANRVVDAVAVRLRAA